MLISHEVPIALLEKSREFNDYDYALVHLFEHEAYFNFYRDSLRIGRKVILDNSIFELGESFDAEKFYNQILRLTEGLGGSNYDLEYIIPDALEECERTISKVKDWNENYAHKLPHLTSIGVVQGKSEKELVDCFNFLKHNVDKIAISFDYDFWNVGNKDQKFLNFAVSRVKFMRKYRKYMCGYDIHLLGCGVPQEFRAYKTSDYNFITTLDTSNPILHGLKGIQYTSNGLADKNTVKMNDVMFEHIPSDKMHMIEHNIKYFRAWIHTYNIAISGTHSTGKTTLVNHLDGLEIIRKQSKVASNCYTEITREIQKEGKLINENGDDSTQHAILNSHVNRVLKSLDSGIEFNVFDRCVLDGYAYTQYLFNIGKVNTKTLQKAKEVFEEFIGFYDTIIFTEKLNVIVDDSVRSTNKDFHEGVYKIFLDLIKKYYIDVIVLHGNEKNRIEKIEKIINNF